MDSPHAVAGDFLSSILAEKRREVAERKDQVPEASLRAAAARHSAPLPVAESLRRATLTVMAEVKRGSPSAGTFNSSLDAARQAASYADAGAAVVSVLTDLPYFGGTLDDLRAARNSVVIPLLRKDFIVDEYQLLEARANGADAVLLIVSALTEQRLNDLLSAAHALGMTALVEVNTPDEARITAASGARLIGINNRNLRTFEVDLTTTERLRPLFPESTVVAALSGIKSAQEARRMRAAGADAVLVGEALVRASDPRALIEQFRSIS